MARFLLALMIVISLISTVRSQSFEDIEMMLSQFLSESPTSMIHNWLEVMEPPEFVGTTLALVASAVKTKNPELELVAQDSSAFGYDCNLTAVEPACFLESLSGVLGESWGTASADLEKANQMIESYLRPRKLIMPAALIACLAADKALKVLSNPHNRVSDTAAAIQKIKTHCTSK